MAYIHDKDLEFLKECSDEELSNLFDILVYDKDRKTRFAETLTISESYKKYGRKFSCYWQEIAGELQEFGGNSFVNLFRGNGVKYDEILNDVLDSLKIKYHKISTVEKRENDLILFIFGKIIEEMPEENRLKLVNEVNIKVSNFKSQTIMAAIQTSLKLGGFLPYQITVIVANYTARIILGRGLSLATNAMLTKSLSVFLGPIGWAVTGIWTGIDIAGPAKRVTIPAVIMVACLRKGRSYRKIE